MLYKLSTDIETMKAEMHAAYPVAGSLANASGPLCGGFRLSDSHLRRSLAGEQHSVTSPYLFCKRTGITHQTLSFCI